MRINRKTFFKGFRERIDETIEQEQVDGLEFLLGQMESDPMWHDVRHMAYALATVFHETAYSFQPVVEGYYLAKTDPPDYAGKTAKVKRFQKTLRYFPYFGRGYVQLTWKENYKKAGEALGVDLVNDPDLAIEPINSYKILTLGLFRGWFGAKLTKYINARETDYVNARRCVNILDKAGVIAGYARSFEKILKSSAAEPAGNSASLGPQNEPTASDSGSNTAEIALQPNDSGTNSSSSATLEAGPEGIKVETSNTPSQNVVIEKRKEEGWIAAKWKQITALFTANGLLDGFTDRFKDFQAFGLSADFWQRIVYLALAASAIYLIADWWKHRSKIKEEIARDQIQAKENSQPGNFVQFAPTEYLQEYRNRGYKVITR
jgi:hypothetical protein